MPIEHPASRSWRGSRLRRARRGTAWGNVCDLFLPNLWGHTLAINRRTHSSPPASGDSDDRIDMARRNFEKVPADVRRGVRGTRRRSLGDLVAFVSLDVEVMVVEIGERASSKSDPVLFLAFR